MIIHAETFATKEDLKVLEANLKAEVAEVRIEIADLRTELRTEIANSRTQMIVWIGGIFAFVQAAMFLALKYTGLAPPV